MEQNTLYSWDFNGEKNRWALWYTLGASAVIGLVIWGFLTKQYGMSFVILLLTGLFYYLENNSNKIIHVDVTSLWISIDNSFYDYGNIASYTMIYTDKYAVYLRLNLTQKWIKNIDLHIDNEIADTLKDILPNYITENPQKKLTLTEKIIHWIQL